MVAVNKFFSSILKVEFVTDFIMIRGNGNTNELKAKLQEWSKVRTVSSKAGLILGYS